MTRTEAFAPAKINLCLHVTGQRADGYHLLDSLVMFADIGDRVFVSDAPEMSLAVSGPMAEGVPQDASNLCWRAACAFGTPVSIQLEKYLPSAAGIGGGSSDAAAVLRAMEQLYQRPAPVDPVTLGADVPVCMVGHAAHMTGIGDHVLPLTMEPLHAVLVNPGVAVSTPKVFAALARKDNAPLSPWPEGGGTRAALRWLQDQSNDLEAPAIAQQPVIGEVLKQLTGLEGVHLARMSGSGATCFALFECADLAGLGAQIIQSRNPQWWVTKTVLS